jgi:hypothetical protein
LANYRGYLTFSEILGGGGHTNFNSFRGNFCLNILVSEGRVQKQTKLIDGIFHQGGGYPIPPKYLIFPPKNSQDTGACQKLPLERLV